MSGNVGGQLHSSSDPSASNNLTLTLGIPGDSWRGNTREPYWTAQARRSDLAGFFAPMGNPEILHSLYSA